MKIKSHTLLVLSCAACVRHRVFQRRISHHWLATALIAALTGTITITDGAPAPDPVPGFHIAETIIVAGDAVTPPTISGILKGGPPNFGRRRHQELVRIRRVPAGITCDDSNWQSAALVMSIAVE